MVQRPQNVTRVCTTVFQAGSRREVAASKATRVGTGRDDLNTNLQVPCGDRSGKEGTQVSESQRPASKPWLRPLGTAVSYNGAGTSRG